MRLSGVERSPQNIAQRWIETHFKSDYRDIVIFAYENVEIDKLNLYTEVIKVIRELGLNYLKTLAYDLMILHLSIPNLDFKSFFTEYFIFFRGKNIYFNLWIKDFDEHIKKINNKRISRLWWIWRDYSGKYSNYIEWLPRETLDDLLMIQNHGIYQPDYTTYIE